MESRHFAQRRELLKYDQILDKQREIVYSQRRELLVAPDITPRVRQMICAAVADAAAEGPAASREERTHKMLQMFSCALHPTAVSRLERCGEAGFADALTSELLLVYAGIESAYSNRNVMTERQRLLLLQTVDAHWAEQLEALEHLRDGIGLTAYAQADPVVKYRRAAFELFEAMNRSIRYDAVTGILRSTNRKEGV